MEELAPKATGREAKIENRRAKSDTIHGGRVGLEEARLLEGLLKRANVVDIVCWSCWPHVVVWIGAGAAARAAEEARDGLALDESITMGGGDEFNTVKKRMQARGERKATDRERYASARVSRKSVQVRWTETRILLWPDLFKRLRRGRRPPWPSFWRIWGSSLATR